ncbi:hypothetical protein GYMLUDRAFT_64741 [Collybiopsis luxurians FD-317 M1]|uniref:Uncharacterized protein n=1 Tax=Collybiopsis luxurians FD-317 M1 TaxID=944289 RepID=A0A0D0BBA3_9AGAR|nr:hypothetical protein GYMLUDRAFT_64741 [Collybiopsis luxurians FD-317 M1]
MTTQRRMVCWCSLHFLIIFKFSILDSPPEDVTPKKEAAYEHKPRPGSINDDKLFSNNTGQVSGSVSENIDNTQSLDSDEPDSYDVRAWRRSNVRSTLTRRPARSISPDSPTPRTRIRKRKPSTTPIQNSSTSNHDIPLNPSPTNPSPSPPPPPPLPPASPLPNASSSRPVLSESTIIRNLEWYSQDMAWTQQAGHLAMRIRTPQNIHADFFNETRALLQKTVFYWDPPLTSSSDMFDAWKWVRAHRIRDLGAICALTKLVVFMEEANQLGPIDEDRWLRCRAWLRAACEVIEKSK